MRIPGRRVARSLVALLTTLVLCLACPAAAQTVYRCKTAKGVSIYSAAPCSKDPAKVKELVVKDRKLSEASAAAGDVEDATAAQGTSEWTPEDESATPEERARLAQFKCTEGVYARVVAPVNARIAEHQARIAKLKAEARDAPVIVAEGATSPLDMEVQALETAIVNEGNAANLEYERLSAECRAR